MKLSMILSIACALGGCAQTRPLSPEQQALLMQVYRPQEAYQQTPYVMPVSRATTTHTLCQDNGGGQVACTSTTR